MPADLPSLSPSAKLSGSGYDVVFALTQAGLNTALYQYLKWTAFPVCQICFTTKSSTAQDLDLVSLEELIKAAGGNDPFHDIPDGTNLDDPRIKALTNAHFAIGIKVRLGIPKGQQYVNTVNLSAPNQDFDHLNYTMYFAEFQVIQNTPSRWNVWTQASGSAWSLSTNVKLIAQSLAQDLDTPHFRKHADEKAVLMKQLLNAGGFAASVQQLVFNFSITTLQSGWAFGSGVPDVVKTVLQDSLIKVYAPSASDQGQALVGNIVPPQDPEPSEFRLSAFEWQVAPFKQDNSANALPNPSPDQQNAYTLQLLGVLGDHQLPAPSVVPFAWNWVPVEWSSQISGVIAVNRAIPQNWFQDKMLSWHRRSLPRLSFVIDPTVHKFEPIDGRQESEVILDDISTVDANGLNLKYTSMDTNSQLSSVDETMTIVVPEWMVPVTKVVPTGNLVTTSVKQQAYKSAPGVTDVAATTDSGNVLAFGALPHRESTLTLSTDPQAGHTLNFALHLVVAIDIPPDITSAPPPDGVTVTFIDRVINEKYPLSLTSNGDLMVGEVTRTTTDSNKPVLSGNLFPYIGTLQKFGQTKVDTPAEIFNGNVLGLDQNKFFILPGGNVFTFAQASYSDHQDLISAITLSANSWGETPVVTPTPSKMLMRAPASSRSRFKTTPSDLQLTHTTDMMQNWLQADLFSPSGKFEALQRDNGHTVLFTLDTFVALQAIYETSGTGMHGWDKYDLSTAYIQANFPSKSAVRTFDVGQSVLDKTMNVAVAVETTEGDVLVVSLGNPHDKTLWVANPSWTTIQFDATDSEARKLTDSGNPLTIGFIYFPEISSLDGSQSVLVDLVPSDGSESTRAIRYIVNVSPDATSPRWVLHSLPFDIDVGTYQSCVGRRAEEDVDGIFTAGSVSGVPQLGYVAVASDGPGPPDEYTFSIPSNVTSITAIAVARQGGNSSSLTYGTTDLYFVGSGQGTADLYRLAADKKANEAVVVLSNLPSPRSVFLGTTKLIAMSHNQVVTLWGQSSSGIVWSMTCDANQVHDPTKWSLPIPIQSGTQGLASFTNWNDDTNTVFAPDAQSFWRIQQATRTSSKMWHSQNVHLSPSSPKQAALSFNSYTTTLSIKDSTNNIIPKDITDNKVSITTQARVPMYINGNYHLLSSTPTIVSPDPKGTVTITEATADINGTVLTISVNDAAQVEINTMDQPYSKMTTLNSHDALKSAQVVTSTTAGGISGQQPTKSLVDQSVSDDDIKTAATQLSSLQTIYAKVPSAKAEKPSPGSMGSRARDVDGIFDDIVAAAGDVYQFMKHEVNSVIQAIEQDADEIWHFVVQIGDDVYHAVLDTVEAVVGAVRWIYNAIKTVVEDIVRFVQFLFEWDDITRTKDVFHNLIEVFVKYQLSDIASLKSQFDDNITDMENAVSAWSQTSAWSLGNVGSNPAGSSTNDPSTGQTSGSQLFSHHLQNQSSNVTPNPDPSVNIVQGFIDTLMDALETAGKDLEDVFSKLGQLATDFPSISVGDALTRLVQIIVDGLLTSTQAVVDAFLDLIKDIMDTLISFLDTEIYIPIISDILTAIGIPSISYLDLLTWVGAVGFTVVYKIAEDKPPFSDDDRTAKLKTAPDWASFCAALDGSSQEGLAVNKPATSSSGLKLAREEFFYIGHGFVSMMGFFGTAIKCFEAAEITGNNPFRSLSGYMSLATLAVKIAVSVAEPGYPTTNAATKDLKWVSSGLILAATLIFSNKLQDKFKAKGFTGLVADDGRATGAWFVSIFSAGSMIASVVHLGELTGIPDDTKRTQTILDEVSSICSSLGSLAYSTAVNSSVDPTEQIPAIALLGLLGLSSSGLQLAEVVVG